MNITKPSRKDIIAGLSYIVIGLFCIIMIQPIFQRERGEETSILGYKPVIIISGSMEPEYMTNCMALVKNCGIDDIEIGDVAVFNYGNLKVSHRVIDIIEDAKGKYLITKGDANDRADDICVTDDMLVGKIVWHTNKVVPIVSYFMISPGEVNPIAITQLLILLIVGITVGGTILYNLVGLIGLVIMVLSKKKWLGDSIDRLNKRIEQREELMDKLDSIEASEDTIVNMLLKARLIRELSSLEKSICDFKKQIEIAEKIQKITRRKE